MLPLIQQFEHGVPDDARGPRHSRGPATSHEGRSITRRGAVRTLALTLAAPILPLGVATRPAKARRRRRTKTITRTFSSDGPITIDGDAAVPYPSIINVRSFRKYKKATIKDVNVSFRDLSHDFPPDIDIMLVHRSRQATILSDAASGAAVVNIELTLDDQASENLPSPGDPLTSGTYRPANLGGPDSFPSPAPAQDANDSLSTFNGDKPDGIWRLYASDDVSGVDPGVIAGGWELKITAKVTKKKKRRRR